MGNVTETVSITDPTAGIIESEAVDTEDGTYQSLLEYIKDRIREYSGLDKLIYENLIQSGTITGEQICATVYEQGVLEMIEELYNGLRNGTLSAYTWLCERIENLEITPGQLTLEPCSAGVVVTDPDTGDVLACVSYPGYDSNRLANTIGTEYYNQLINGMNNIFYIMDCLSDMHRRMILKYQSRSGLLMDTVLPMQRKLGGILLGSGLNRIQSQKY